ncbi:MAG: DMT family transporter [Paracoccaceae bacterium]|nr:DMT family transporter [Paracoccaceae bacterium]
MSQRSDNAQGALLMVGSQVAFTVNDAFMKALSDEVPFFQAMFIRGVAVVAVMALLAAAMGQLRFRVAPEDRWRLLVRTAAEAAAAYFFISALFNMPIANAIAILQVLPLAVALAAWLVFGEPLGWRRLLAIAVGFVGVMLIVRPGFEGFTIWSLYALGAVLAVTVRDLATRAMTSSLPSLTVAFAGSLGVMVFAGFGAAATEWAPMTGHAAGQMAGAVVAIVLAYLLSVAVMRVGEIGFVAPFRYASLVAALFLGLAVFGEWPDGLTLIGSVIVVATGLYMLWRERVLATARRRV